MRAVNLIPAEQRGGASVGAGRSQGAAHAVLVTVAGLALMAFLYGLAHHQISSRKAEAATLTARAQAAQAAAERLAPYTSFAAMREQRTQAVDTLVDSRFDWAHAFHELGRVLPRQASISTLSGTVASTSTTSASSSSGTSASATVTSSTPPGSIPEFTLSGCATSQPVVALTLERLRLIDGVKAVTLASAGTAVGGAGGGGGSCPEGAPSFTAQIVFDALPSATTAAAASRAVSDAGASSSAAAPATTSATGKGAAR